MPSMTEKHQNNENEKATTRLSTEELQKMLDSQEQLRPADDVVTMKIPVAVLPVEPDDRR